jgi:Fic family protein
VAEAIKRHWTSTIDAGLSRKDRRSCDYEAYVPDRLVGRQVVLDGPVAADVSEAEAALARFDVEVRTLSDSEALARLLLRTEAVASSRIEGLEIGARRLLRADAERRLGETSRDVNAAEVLGNIDAMLFAVQSVDAGGLLSIDLLLEIHRRLLRGTRLEMFAGRLRDEQNWIGGSSFNPCSAEFVPPPPELVPELLADLCDFCNDDMLPAVAQAAIAHAQFETVHPFVDGNGRVGRALIHLVLRRRGAVSRVLPPVSLTLATWNDDYVSALGGTRYLGPATSAEAQAGLDRWVGLFAAACRRAIADADAFEQSIEEVAQTWRERLGRVRAGSALDRLVRALPGAPVVTVQSAAELLGRSGQATNQAIARLVDAGVLKQTSVGRRNRAFEAGEVIDAFTDLERQLASPSGDTQTAPPARRVPRRRPTPGAQ